MPKYVALLRGINVGGNNMLPMKTLAAMFADEGATDVRTYIQSGNVVFAAPAAAARKLPARVTGRIAADLGLKVPIMLRSPDELAEVTRSNPYLATAGEDTKALYVMFLADKPTAAAVASLDPKRSPPDEFVVTGREIYLRFPNGAGRSKLTSAYFDAKLSTISTARNWRTITTLLQMVG